MARSRKRGRNRVNATGRNEGQTPRFALLPHAVLLSQAYRSLSAVARALLVEIVMIENGKNNGSLWLGVKDAVDRLGMTDARPIMQAFEDLCETGLIKMTKDAHFSVKVADTSRARCWRLTWLAFDSKAPTNDWQAYVPPPQTRENKRATKGMKAMARYRKQLSSHKMPVVDFTAIASISS